MIATGKIPPMQLYLHYFNYRWRRRADPSFDLHALIQEAADLGFSGINLGIQNPPHLFLESHEASYLGEVRAHLEECELGVDTEINGTDLTSLATGIEVSNQLGAEYLRTYTLPEFESMDDAVEGLREAAPRAEAAGITLLLENHEDLTATEVATILKRVNHERVQALFDYGNSVVFMEDPLESARVLARYTRTAHLKDHVAVRAGIGGDEALWVGVSLGEGSLPLVETTRILQEGGMRRVCFENCWGYDTPFRDRRGTGRLGEGVWTFVEPPFDPEICLPGTRNPEVVARHSMPLLEKLAMNQSLRWLQKEWGGFGWERPLNLDVY